MNNNFSQIPIKKVFTHHTAPLTLEKKRLKNFDGGR